MGEHIMQFFAYEHLPPKLQVISKPFCDLARIIVGDGNMAGVSTSFPLPRNPERTVALRKLLEAKDAAVRAAIASEFAPSPVICHRCGKTFEDPLNTTHKCERPALVMK